MSFFTHLGEAMEEICEFVGGFTRQISFTLLLEIEGCG